MMQKIKNITIRQETVKDVKVFFGLQQAVRNHAM